MLRGSGPVGKLCGYTSSRAITQSGGSGWERASSKPSSYDPGMRVLSWTGFAVSAALALYGLLGLPQLRRAPGERPPPAGRRSDRPSRAAALRVLAFGVGLWFAVVFLLAALDDGRR